MAADQVRLTAAWHALADLGITLADLQTDGGELRDGENSDHPTAVL